MITQRLLTFHKVFLGFLWVSTASLAIAETPRGFHARVTFSAGETGAPVNRLVAGTNIQWVDRGDELLRGESTEFSADMLAKVRDMGPTILRYPGGSQSDTYRWKDGLGGSAERKSSEHYFSRRKQKVLFGTPELLRLCRELGAEPLLTVNVVTGTPEEAAEWVAQVNKTGLKDDAGKPLPAARHWEIGNEPYLKESRPDLALQPREFAQRAARFIAAMKKADPSILVGIPLRSDRIGGVPANHFPGFNDAVLKELGEAYDFVALHDAYVPYTLGAPPPREVWYGAAVNADTVIEDDLAFTRGLLEQRRPGRKIPLAITEHNAIFTLSGGPTDRYTTSLTAALVTANLLRLLAERDDILCANHWSLSGNGFFGAISNKGRIRPTFHVLRGFSRLSKGRRVALDVETPRQDTPAAGLVAAQKGRPIVTALAAREGQTLRLMLLNKHVSQPVSVTLSASDKTPPAIARASQGEVWTEDYFADGDGVEAWSERPLLAKAWPVELQLKPHSVSFIEIEMGGSLGGPPAAPKAGKAVGPARAKGKAKGRQRER